MYVSELQLLNFRNYESLELTLSPGISVFLGPNGQGKTNLIEAINYFAIVGSHRTPDQAALVKNACDFGVMRVRLRHETREALLETQLNVTGSNKAQINKKASKMSDFPRQIAVVLFSPEDLLIVRGEPNNRRSFLDEYITMQSPKYAGTRADYERVLKQRNSLLKSASVAGKKIDSATLDVWDEKLVTLAAEIFTARISFLEQLTPYVVQAYQQIAGEEHLVKLSLSSTVTIPSENEVPFDATAYAAHYSQQLASDRSRELERGMTLSGPHRDDVEFLLNDMLAKSHASHGETWSLAIALKLGTAQLLRQHSLLGDPILILDDVFAELDTHRRNRLARAVSGFEQTLITAAVAEDVPEQLSATIFTVTQGVLS